MDVLMTKMKWGNVTLEKKLKFKLNLKSIHTSTLGFDCCLDSHCVFFPVKAGFNLSSMCKLDGIIESTDKAVRVGPVKEAAPIAFALL